MSWADEGRLWVDPGGAEWVPVAQTAAYVRPWGTRTDEEREWVARSRAAAGGLTEANYLAACARFDIEVRPLPAKGGRRVGEASFEMAIPVWAAIFLEATLPKSKQQADVLKRARDDLDFRDTCVAAWRLGGLGAVVRYIEGEPTRYKEPRKAGGT